MYIIQQVCPCENRYFIRETLGLTSWGSMPGSAAQYETKEEAQLVCDRQLQGFHCEVIEI